MNSFKNNTLIKWVVAYVDLFYKAFPIIIIFFLLPQILKLIYLPKLGLDNYDILGLFNLSTKEEVAVKNTLFIRSLVLFLNISVIVGIYVSLKKITEFVKNVFDGNPFCGMNGKNLKFVGSIVAITAAAIHIVNAFLFVPNSGELNSYPNSFLILVSNIISTVFNVVMILGLFIIMIGEILLQGSKIKEENDLTV